DTGKGMSEDVRKKIFDPFFTTRRPQGTGLGMSVSYSVVKRHDGKIEVESEEGKGSTVNLSFPIKREIAQQKLSSKPEAHEIKAKGLRILVVEDNDDMCMIMNNALTRGGHTVKISNNGAEAIALASKEDFDLVLSDLAMPDVNGYEVVKMLNKLEKRPKIGIITGWSEQLELFDKEEMKVDFILRKPFKHIELAKQINELFGADS
ncbi:MAG: response regulator, partial [Candidatus Scalindua sp.]|nr:response regulator [Candidatus Scalindua sp.]